MNKRKNQTKGSVTSKVKQQAERVNHIARLSRPNAPYRNKSLKDLKGEKWEEIPGTEGYYLISNYGRVKGVARYIENINGVGTWRKAKILSQCIGSNKNHYKNDYRFGTTVTYQVNNQRFVSMVRRLVYQAFIAPTTKESMENQYVYPKDGNGLNSHVSNLGLVTKSEMRKMTLAEDRYIPPAFKIDQEANRKHLLRLNRKKRRSVKQYHLNGKLLRWFPSVTVASRKTGISGSCISASARGNWLQCGGFVWRYDNDNYKGELRDWKGLTKEVIQFTVGGKRLKTYSSIVEASRACGIDSQSIIRSAKKRSKRAGDFVWRYTGDTYCKGDYKNLHLTDKIVQYNLKGKRLGSFDKISDAAKSTNSTYEGIRLVLRKKQKTHNGFIWKYGKK